MSLVITLSSSSFFLPDYLDQQLVKNDYNQDQLAYALSLHSIVALMIKQNTAPKASQTWLSYTIELAKKQPEQAFLLADFYLQKYQQSNDSQQRAKWINKIIFWYQQAIKLGSEEGLTALAHWFYQHQRLIEADKVLSTLNEYSLEQVILRIRILVDQGKTKQNSAFIAHYLPLLSANKAGRSFLVELRRYQIIENILPKAIKNISIKHCEHSVQFFATRLVDLIKTEQLIQQFKQHSLANFVCFLPVRYIAITELDCVAQKKLAIRCNEATWLAQSKNIHSKYLGLLLPHGGANVHLGMIYLDSEDNVQIFAHEISHLLGFIDEYPLPKQHQICQQVQKTPFAHNLAILNKEYQGDRAKIRKQVLSQVAWAKQIKEDTPILQAKNNITENRWVLGTPARLNHNIGIFPAETCANSVVNAFKPVAYQTQLRYNENRFPLVYIEQLKNNNKFSMPSFHYNITLALTK